MPRTTTTLKLDGHSYTVMFLSSSQAIETATEVGAALLPALGRAFPKGGLKTVSLADLDLDLGAGFETLALSMQPAKILTLLKTLCSCVALDGQGLLVESLFEEHFKGAPGQALKVAAKSFEVNCGDFFASAVSLAGLTKRAVSTQGPQK